jgi:ADP-ribose pyrophosphatase YjhB (NUDIX family)
VKESLEEAGVNVIAKSIIAIHDRDIRNYPPLPHGCYKIFVECSLIDGEFTENSETSDARWFRLDELPPLSTERITEEQIQMCFEHRDRNLPAEFD